MAAGTFLGMEPEVTAAGLTEADPVVLSMITAHLEHKTTRAGEFQRLGCALLLSLPPLLASHRIEQFVQLPP